MSTVAEHQPDPFPGRQVVLYEVLRDFTERAEAGKLRYGMYLETHNGRDALMDAYQESIDNVMYTKQMLMEQEWTREQARILLAEIAESQFLERETVARVVDFLQSFFPQSHV